MLHCCVGDHVNNWDQVLPIAEFTYNSLVNGTIGHSLFKIVTGSIPRKPIEACPNVEAEALTMHKLHDVIQRKIASSNEGYNVHADLKRWFAVLKRRHWLCRELELNVILRLL